MTKMYWYTSSSGRIEFQLTLESTQRGMHQGQCDDDIASLLEVPYIKEQLAKLDPAVIRTELQEIFFDGDDPQCDDVANNLKRLLWIACGDIQDNLNESDEDDN